MVYQSFQLLCEKLHMPILALTKKNQYNSKTHHAHNGLIHHTFCVACAIQIFLVVLSMILLLLTELVVLVYERAYGLLSRQ